MTPDQLEDLLSNRLHLDKVRRSGRNILALCPNHSENRPSWGINTSAPHVHACFSCGYKGTLRTLLIDKGWTITAVTDLLGARQKLNSAFSLSSPSVDSKLPSEEEIWPFILDATAIRYMRKRGINPTTLKKAKVVFHPLDQRVLFPWYLNGQFFGATGRTIEEFNPVKVQAYFELRKSHALYSPLGRLPTTEVIVPLVEGEIDALTVFQAGFKHVLALGKGTLSNAQADLLESLPVKSDLVLFFDNDHVGKCLCVSAFKTLSKRGFKKIRVVDWSSTTSKGKLDPGALDAQRINQLISSAPRASFWSIKYT